MPKKMKLPTLFRHKNPPPQHQPSVSSSTRHSCREQPKTHSFRATPSADLNSSNTLRNSSAEELENVIRGVKTSSDRLFFSPEKSNSILENNAKHSTTQENAPIAITIKSRDPYKDFMTSMEEMVKAHDLRDWDLLEELLGCYLMVNEKRNHCYIIRAFVDLVVYYSHIVHLTTSSGCSSVSDSFVVTSSSSPLHFSSSSTTAGTSSSSSFAPKKAAHDGGRADKFLPIKSIMYYISKNVF